MYTTYRLLCSALLHEAGPLLINQKVLCPIINELELGDLNTEEQKWYFNISELMNYFWIFPIFTLLECSLSLSLFFFWFKFSHVFKKYQRSLCPT